jgi:hypothetical protein
MWRSASWRPREVGTTLKQQAVLFRTAPTAARWRSNWIRSRCGAYQRRAHGISAGQLLPSDFKCCSVFISPSHRPIVREPGYRIARRSDRVERPSSRVPSGPKSDRRQQLHNPKAGNSVTRVPRKAQQHHQVLTCALSSNFRPPNFTKGMFRRVNSPAAKYGDKYGDKPCALPVLRPRSTRCGRPLREVAPCLDRSGHPMLNRDG